ncbi:MAG: Gfo/Idh/MocA family oxidoreductase, partial [Pseudomonadota bacterium]|nr:Gfo/Idh/MocA family oxidoreductase [Pseudomonadota bacterium]
IVRTCYEMGALAAVCDTNAESLAAVGVGYPGVALCSDLGDMLRRPVDAFVVATPAQTHLEVAMACLRAGRPVFVEKPLALSVREGEQILEASERSGVPVFVGHVLLYHPAVKELRSLLARDEIGPVWHLRSRRLNLGIIRSTESVWWSFAPHDIALMLAILGEEPQAAAASHSGYLQPGIPDMSYVDFRFNSGRSAHIEVSWADAQRLSRLEVFGTKGVLVLDDAKSGSSLTLHHCGAKDNGQGKLQAWRDDAVSIEVPTGQPLACELSAFFDSVANGQAVETDARQGVSVLRALSMADEAAAVSQMALAGAPA